MNLKMSEQNLKNSNIFLGLINILFGVIILSIANISIETTFIILSITLFIIAFARIINSISDKTLILPLTVLKFITSFISIFLAIIIIFSVSPYALFNLNNTLIVFGILFTLIGMERIISGILLKNLIKAYRTTLKIFGVLTVILSISILILSFLNYRLAIYSIPLVLIISGLARILHGIYLNYE